MSTISQAQTREQNLAQANEIRHARRELKGRVRAAGRDGARTIAACIVADEGTVRTMWVIDLLDYIPRIGSAVAATMMGRAGIGLTRRCGDLTVRQRSALAAALTEWTAPKPTAPKPPAAPAPDRAPSASRGRCKVCGDPLMRRTAEMVCGFCVEEREAA
jgi:hypothetical protein